MRIIGITGGVGAGKSMVLQFLEREYKAAICEADKAAHLLYEPGQSCYVRIREAFGEGILNTDGTIDRKALGELVFGDREALEKLNRIVHPAVKAYIRGQIQREQEKGTALFVVEAALLIEEHYEEICDELWYIYAEPGIRRVRLKKSRGYTDSQTDRIMANQKPDDVFRKHCRITIDNSRTVEDTCIQVKKALES